MNNDNSLEAWAKSLVGRDWEIYWENNHTSLDESAESENKRMLESVSEGAENEEEAESAFTRESNKEEDTDEEDWYDGHVEEIESRKDDGSYSFRVRFVGDDTLYNMVLVPRIVRPSARAWIKRSKALLEPSKKSRSDWEKSLPPDTRTTSDAEQLAKLESQYVDFDFLMRGESSKDAIGYSDGEAQGMPAAGDLNQIQRLATLLSAQLYLRTKLAPIAEHTGGPSEAYVDHLLQCLECLDEASQWYVKCCRLHQKVFFDNQSPPDDSALVSARLDEDYAIREGLQEGRRVITRLLRVDTSLAGSKRRRPAEASTGGTRKTKRRRRNKSLLDFIKESERGSKTPRPEDDEFLSSEAVTNFADQVNCNDSRWYTKYFGKMMQSVSLNIVEPLLIWRCKVETVLGDRPEAEVDGEQTDGETSEEDSEEEGNERTGSHQPEQRFYAFGEIKSFEESGNHDPILRNFDLSRLQDRLGLKLTDIQAFERSCWSSMSQVFSTPLKGIACKENDSIYSELERLQASAVTATSSLNNVSPLGSSSSVLCRKNLDDALTLRSWYLDLHRVESSRERLVFIDKMATRASELPRLPHCEFSASLDGLFDEAVTRLRKISQGYFDHLTRFNKFRSMLLSRSDLSNDEGVDFRTIDGVSVALHALGEIQVLSIAEEMLSVRLDVLRWKKDADAKLAQPKVSFDELVALKKKLDQIQKGCSETRSRILVSIETNDKVNTEIRSFAEADVTAFCGSTMSLVNSKYVMSCTWKERADSIVCAINQHSQQQSNVQKLLPMVDLKRVNGLMRDYQDSGIFLPDDLSFLNNVYEAATKWSQELTAFLMDEGMPFADLLSRLQASKIHRPKGIIVDPARHVVDSMVDVLAWHQQSVETMKQSNGKHVEGNKDLAHAPRRTSRCVYTLVGEGSEILEAFGTKGATDFVVNSVAAQNLMYKQLESRRPMRVIARTKLESNPLGRSLIDRIIQKDVDEGSPLRYLSLILWQAAVADFVEKYGIKKGTKDSLTLESAKDLASKRPWQETPGDCNGALCKTSPEITFMELIASGQCNEAEALRLLGSSKEMFRGLGRRIDAMQKYFADVKDLQNRFRAPFAVNGSGLALSKTLEQQLDQLSKVLGWLVRTFPYPFLYQAGCEVTQESRIPWDVLVGLNERKPVGLENMGDCAGIALRVSEAFDAAAAWQTEISKLTMLSFRGAKRRGEESECGAHPTVDVEHVRRLVRDPVLRKVAMPRESAVSEILQSAKTFERHLHCFLGKDFNGKGGDTWQDRAPYPDTQSLLGRSGEFLLYRLTGSPLYTSLLSKMEHISSIGEDCFADTPEKVAFEWIRHAVAWIDSVRAAVKSQANTAGAEMARLVIDESDARKILDNGKNFFLDIPEDLKKTLSTHRIFMSTNRVAEKLKVVFKKGGAHHSVGGTAVKWCPIIFDSLKEDVVRLDLWKAQVQTLRLRFQAFSKERDNGLAKNELDVLSLTHFYEELVMLWEERIESLVIAPSKDVLDAMNDLHKELQMRLQDILKERSLVLLNQQIANRRFQDIELFAHDRVDLLDALLARSCIEFECSDQVDKMPSCDTMPSDDHFRNLCRASIEEALQSAVQMMGLDQADPTLPVVTHYSVKAAEIEQEMQARFQAGTDTAITSFNYKEKERTLSWVLGDCVNPKLCVKVLLGEIDAAALVSMHDMELLGDWKSLPDMGSAKMEKMELPEFAVQRGLHGTNGTDSDNKLEMKTIVEDDINSPGGESASHDLPEHTVESAELSAKQDSKNPVLSLAMPEDLGAPPSLAANATASGLASRPVKRPHAPPSLAASLAHGGLLKRTNASRAYSSTKNPCRRNKYLLNSSGHDIFLLAVSKALIQFRARFLPENDPQGVLNGVLPENLSEKGRLRIEEFTKFLSGKLKGGKWSATRLRMSLFSSDEDAKKHKKFYKEYESMRRITMFAVSENSKLFLVTPKFHRVAAKALGSSLSAETSTYAIALTRVSADC